MASRSTGRPPASDAEREKQARQWQGKNNGQIITFPTLTLELAQLLLSLRAVAGIARQLVALGPAVLVELVHADAELVEDGHRISDGDVQPAGVLGVLGACCGQQEEVAGEEVRECERGLGGRACKAVGVERL